MTAALSVPTSLSGGEGDRGGPGGALSLSVECETWLCVGDSPLPGHLAHLLNPLLIAQETAMQDTTSAEEYLDARGIHVSRLRSQDFFAV